MSQTNFENVHITDYKNRNSKRQQIQLQFRLDSIRVIENHILTVYHGKLLAEKIEPLSFWDYRCNCRGKNRESLTALGAPSGELRKIGWKFEADGGRNDLAYSIRCPSQIVP
ncbi:hypothetical protein AVEN_236623-1 [Araneus ventricosus]|uniref:Uncharacterized protein n=2 Tax=Araneus ventricosus TaxID=182803 RepID=A0A4Y2PLR3_ARAVE|nr:hypothetical protein AVEN_236623-1 [Araneus ventricosus]